MKNMILKQPGSLIATLAVSALMAACAPKSGFQHEAPLGTPQAQTSATAVKPVEIPAPKVDILFVIDTSESMDIHQENLKKNIDKFVAAFNSHQELDFHIGVVSIWDSSRYGKQNDKGQLINPPYPLGLLRPLKDPARPGEAVPGVPYVTRAPRFAEILGESLKLGIEPFQDKAGNDLGGPQAEETFASIVPALSGQNGDFYRPDANLAVVMLTDADDAGFETPSQLRDQLIALKGGDRKKISVHAALALSGCKTDPGLVDIENGKRVVKSPSRNISLVKEFGGKVVNLCDSKFGDKLEEVGNFIQQHASVSTSIPLGTAQPEPGTIVVTYNGNILAPGGAWSYDEVKNEIQIRPEHKDISSQPGGKLEYSFVPVDPARVKKGKIVPIGKR